MNHPAAEIVSIAVKKIQKVGNSKKFQPLLDACQALLDEIPAIFPPAPASGSPTLAHHASGGQSLQQRDEAGVLSPGAVPADAGSIQAEDSQTMSVTPAETSITEDAAPPPTLGPVLSEEVKSHFEVADLVEAAQSSVYTSTGGQQQPSSTSQEQPAPGFRVPDLVPRTETALADEVTLRVVSVMRMAVETDKPNIIEVALDCLQKLIAFKFLQGTVFAINLEKPGSEPADADKIPVQPDDPSTKTPQAQAIELMCRCDAIPDDGVELNVLRGLLTASTASTFTIHGQALLLAVRTCYNIYIMSRSDVNQTTAKATLTQMLNVVFQRMEADDVIVEVKPLVLADMLGLNRSAVQDAASMIASTVQSFLNNVVMVTGSVQSPEEIRSSVAGAFISDRNSVTPDQRISDGSAPDVPSGPELSKISMSEDLHEHAADAAQAELGVPGHRQALVLHPVQQTAEEQARSQVLQKDAFLVFRALCKLSIRTNDQVTLQDAAALRGKLLALELLKVLLENSGPIFRRSETFISAIRQYLCLSLLKNSPSNVPGAPQLSCSIFLSLLSKFRTHLKAEVAVFFPMILLKLFEPTNPQGAPQPNAPLAPPPVVPSTPAMLQQKVTILRVLSELCRDGQLLVDIFVNYDCDLDSSNLFERMVNALVRLAQQPPATPPAGPISLDAGNQYHHEMYLRMEALQALVNMVEAMLHWYRLTANLVEVDLSTASNGIPGSSSTHDLVPDTPALLPSSVDASTSNLRELAASDDTMSFSLPQGAAAAALGGEAGGDDFNAKRQFKAKLQEGVNMFNKKPKKGIEFLQREGILAPDVASVATFLLKTKGLDKTQIGDYLGERNDYHIKVMHVYVDQMDFTDLEFDAAIRLFLAGFRLPGEAQKIDRLMEKFAERYISCNPGSFKSADVAYVLAYSVIMLNTDLHNPQVKKKMSKESFLKNNRGINDGHDLPEEFLSSLYDRILGDEIKMKEEGEGMALSAQDAVAQSRNFLTTLLSIMGAFRQEQHTEPSEESIKKTLDFLHEKAKGSMAVTVSESEAVRPMMEVIWAPLLGALSVLFDEYQDVRQIGVCLQGIAASCCLASLIGMTNLRDVFIHSLCGFTHLHSAQTMRLKNALAFQYLLRVASPDNVGDHLDDRWVDVLRCISRWELLQQIASGMPTDAALFSQSNEKGVKAVLKRVLNRDDSEPALKSMDSLAMSEASMKKLHGGGPVAGGPFSKKNQEEQQQVQNEIVNSFDTKELNAVFLNSSTLNSEAVVDFVRALCLVSYDELESAKTPRIFSMARLVEVAHHNMTRIRLVWSRIWAVLSDYFIHVGCHPNLQVAMYSVDSLRQLAMKFLERDELANYTFQNDFLRPFVAIMRKSQAVEVRELIIRCLSQMVLARVDNVKSGWKSMFMVFTTAAGDKEQEIVNLAFDTIEKIVRLHFNHITETETTTFTDCVNCLIAFTNNPHSSTVALNSIAFLRFCAVKLAEGAIGDVNLLPEGVSSRMTHHPLRVVALDTVPEVQTLHLAHSDDGSGTVSTHPSPFNSTSAPSQPANGTATAASSGAGPAQGDAASTSASTSAVTAAVGAGVSAGGARTSSAGQARRTTGNAEPGEMKFVDRDEHIYFWFPLLAGLSELTFDPRDQIRNSALEVLFDTLKAHGGSFAASFWRRVFDSVLMPIFDHVRAEVTDTTTFTNEKKREKEDYWLYETCKRCLQHLIDVFVMFYEETQALLPQVLDLLSGFIKRTHQSLAGGGTFALTHLINTAAPKLDPTAWQTVTTFLLTVSQETAPNALELLTPPTRNYQSGSSFSGSGMQGGQQQEGQQAEIAPHLNHDAASAQPYLNQSLGHSGSRTSASGYSLREGIGARRLSKFKSQASVQLLLVQSCSDIYIKQHHLMPASAVNQLLRTLDFIAGHARGIEMDTGLRRRLAIQQVEDRVPEDRVVLDPPLLRLETEAAHSYLSVLLHIISYGDEAARASCNALERMVELCVANLTRFAVGGDPRASVQPDPQYVADAVAKQTQLQTSAAMQAAEAASNGVRVGGFLGVQLGGKTAEAQRRASLYASAVAAATHGRTSDNRSIIVGRTSSGMLVLMAAPAVEYAPFTPLMNSTLSALSSIEDSLFNKYLHQLFPLMTALISTDYAPVEVMRALADLLARRVGPIVAPDKTGGDAAAELAQAAATVRQQAEQQVQKLIQQQQ